MIERKHLEELLRANGLAPDSGEEDVRLILSGARLTEEEIVSALTCLREKTDPTVIPDNASRKLFRSGEALQPGEISQLLGVNVLVKEVIFTDCVPEKASGLFRFMSLWLISVILAATILSTYMFMHKVGVFHPAMEGITWHRHK